MTVWCVLVHVKLLNRTSLKSFLIRLMEKSVFVFIFISHSCIAFVWHTFRMRPCIMKNRRSPASYALVCLPRWDNKENWMERRTGARVWKRLAEANVHSTWFKKALKSFISHRNLTNSLFHFSLFSAPAIESVFLRWNFHFHTFSFISS